MSEMYEAACEIREPLAGLRDAVERIAELLDSAPADGDAVRRLDRLEAILLELYPDSCARHGLARADAPTLPRNPNSGFDGTEWKAP